MTNTWIATKKVGNYMFNVNKGVKHIQDTETTPWRRFGVFIVNFEQISQLCSSVSIVRLIPAGKLSLTNLSASEPNLWVGHHKGIG